MPVSLVLEHFKAGWKFRLEVTMGYTLSKVEVAHISIQLLDLAVSSGAEMHDELPQIRRNVQLKAVVL